ncbi:carbohydrate ABC transporter permease [Diplocloster hominis]|uniref:carbohydrate ABC transporter permease n=1 Tax=Diplocloster hominis TaxID=3079010 RepID=UPI0031BA9C5B
MKLFHKVKKYKAGDWLILLCLILLAVIWIVPLVNSFFLSLKGNGLVNYQTVFTFKIKGQYFLPRMFLNSVLVVGGSLVIILAFSSLAAYAFSKLKFRGRNFLFILILSFYSIPVISILLPISTIERFLNLKDTYFAMIIPMVAINLPLALMILKNFFDTIPDSFIEAATIDGSNTFTTFFYVLLPMVSPAVVNVLVVVFMLTWNDYTIPLMFNSVQSHYTLTMAPGFFNLALNKSDIGPLFASIIVIAIPTIIFYIFMQDKLKSGLTAGGIKE